MATRPTRDPQWATTPAEPISEPSAGLRAAGYVGGDLLPSNELNAVLNNLGDVAKYVLDGTLAPATLTGAPSVTVNAVAKTLTRAAGSWIADGFAVGQRVTTSSFSNAGNNTEDTIAAITDAAITLTSGLTLVNETDATVAVVSHVYVRARLTCSQPTHLQQTLDVDGVTTLGGAVNVLGAATFDLDVQMDSNATVAGDLTVGQDLAVDGNLYHGDMTLQLNVLGHYLSANLTPDSGGWVISTGAATAVVPIPMRVGDRIKTLSYARSGNSSANLTGTLLKYDSAGGAVTLATSGPTAHGATWAATTLNPTDTLLAAGESLVLFLVMDAAGMKVSTVSALYDRPAP